MISFKSLFAFLVIMTSCITSKNQRNTKLPSPNKHSIPEANGARENTFFFVLPVKMGVYVFLNSQGKRDSILDSKDIQVDEYTNRSFIFSAENSDDNWKAYSGKKVVIFDGNKPICEGILEKPRLLGFGTPYGLIDGGPHSDTYSNLGIELESIHKMSEKEFRSAIPLGDFWKRMIVRPSALLRGCKINKISHYLWAQEKQNTPNFGLHVKGDEQESIINGIFLELKHWLADESQNIFKRYEKEYPDSVDYAKDRIKDGIQSLTVQAFSSKLKENASNEAYFGQELFLSFTIENPLSVNECATENLSQLWKRTDIKWQLLYSTTQFDGELIILGDIDGDNTLEFLIRGIYEDILFKVTEKGVVVIKLFSKIVYFQEC